MTLEREFQAMLNVLREVAECPVDWDTDWRASDLADRLTQLWIETCQRHQVRLEAGWAKDDHGDGFDPDSDLLDELRADLQNLRRWIDAASEEYLARTRRFWNLHIDDPRKKHAAKAGNTVDELRAYSARTGISILYPGVSDADLLESLWIALCAIVDGLAETSEQLSAKEAFWQRILDAGLVRIACRSVVPIGATAGSDTDYFAIEISASTQTAHVYPVTRQEAHDVMGDVPVYGFDELAAAGQWRASCATDQQRPFGTPKRR